MIEDIRALFKQDKDYHKPTKISCAFNDKYIECDSNTNYINEIRPHLKDVLKKF